MCVQPAAAPAESVLPAEGHAPNAEGHLLTVHTVLTLHLLTLHLLTLHPLTLHLLTLHLLTLYVLTVHTVLTLLDQ